MSSPLRFLVIGAHPDDPDIRFGGSAIKLIQQGHFVKFVSLTNGNCGHQNMQPELLAKRRWQEAQDAAKILGVDSYEILDINDCELEVNLITRKKLMKIIRDFRPDMVLSHRSCDYHSDHRACAQLVQDCAFMVQVPLFCPESKVPEKNPVFAFLYDAFTKPEAFRMDAIIPIDDVLEQKNKALDCHKSQFYEWLPFIMKLEEKNFEEFSWKEKSQYLTKYWGERFAQAAKKAKETLQETYGEKAKEIKYTEVFEISEYGRKVSKEEFQEMLEG